MSERIKTMSKAGNFDFDFVQDELLSVLPLTVEEGKKHLDSIT